MRQIKFDIHLGSWYFIPFVIQNSQWSRHWTWLIFTLWINWPPKGDSVSPEARAKGNFLPQPEYADCVSTTHFTRK